MYATPDEYEAYAESAGVTLDYDLTEYHLEQAGRYIDAQESKLMGQRTEEDQANAFPRTDLYVNGYEVDEDTIPNIVKQCQMELALDIAAGINLFERGFNAPVTKERVDVIEVHYAQPSRVSQTEKTSLGMQLLRQLFSKDIGRITLVRS